MNITPVIDYLEKHKDQHLKELIEFLKIPSISALKKHKPDIEKAADFMVNKLEELDLDVEKIQTPGNPLVYAQSKKMDPSKKTLLFYGHYDVQPVDPIDLWDYPPFEPTIVNDTIYARGVSDDKGQLYSHLMAIEAFRQTSTEIPVNIKIIFEGEEEGGGENIYKFTENNPEKLACDAVIISDTSQYNENTPAICYSLKGIVYMEFRVKGSGMDLHSGSFGGVVKNACNGLAEIIADLKNKDGVIQIPGFYDNVLELEQSEKEEFASLQYSDEVLKKDTGSSAPHGEKGYTTLERMWGRPTLDVNGIWGGYSGEGGKTIIPSTAGAKVSMRLVPNQNPQRIAKLFREYVLQVAHPSLEVEVDTLHTAVPVLIPRDHEITQSGINALEKGFANKAKFIREGGSIPIVATFQKSLKAPVLLLGYGLPNDNIHSPNERYLLQNFYNGNKTTAYLFDELS
ncbi:MAG: dipeptidase [Deltaproteobacteria bacterium]|jgi:acetylornithine deacetylase/succinyl-diaminopimelate desuccinylase-like protein|nr:dipeptidase [Deltaproteobacteria bacterium]